mgnify:CR=1 FL=1|tara:strand:- start:1189 stop:2325 length:1137 start_codon:yes stop_codon:yes gene_type:complete
MATYYVDPTASGNDDGTSLVDAWTSLSYAPLGLNGTAPVAGDVVECIPSGGGATDETISSAMQFNGNSGNTTAGRITYRAYSATGERYIISGGGIATYCLELNGADWISLEGLEIKDATSHGIYLNSYASYDSLLLNNIWSHDNDGSGFYSKGSSSTRYAITVRCMFSDNGLDGWKGDGMVLGSCAHDNGSSGFTESSSHPTTTYIDCVSFGNGVNGFDLRGYGNDFYLLHNCVASGNTSLGMDFTGGMPAVVSGCRITDNGTGADASNGMDIIDSYMPASGQPLANTTNLGGTTLANQIDNSSTSVPTNSNDLAGTDLAGGYVGGSPFSYQTTASATLHNEPYTLCQSTEYPRTAGLSTLVGGGTAEGYNPFSSIRF